MLRLRQTCVGRCEISRFAFRVSSFGFRVSRLGFRVSGKGRDEGFGTRASAGLGLKVALRFEVEKIEGLGFTVQGAALSV